MQASRHGRGTKAVRRAGSALALVVTAGAVLTALPGVGAIAQTIAAATGYADFGYATDTCEGPVTSRQTLNGDRIRVCQSTDATAGARFVGRTQHPLAGGGVRFVLGLPGLQKIYSQPRFNAGSATGSSFTPGAVDPIVAGTNPIVGSVHYFAGTTATIDQTATYVLGAAQFGLSWRVVNTSGSPLQIRPSVAVRHALNAPAFSAGNASRITLSDPNDGGSVSIVPGSPAFGSFGAGELSALVATLGDPTKQLPNTTGAGLLFSPLAAAQWVGPTPATLAPGASATYSANIDMTSVRELLLSRADAAPLVQGVPLTVRVTAADDANPVAGKRVYWTSANRNPSSGTFLLDAAGHGSFVVPADNPRLTTFSAFLDADGDGVRDPHEPTGSGRVFRALAPPPPPPPPPARDATPPTLKLGKPTLLRLSKIRNSGFTVTATVDEPAAVAWRLVIDDKTARRLKFRKKQAKTKTAFPLGQASAKAAAVAGRQSARLHLKHKKAAARRLRRHTTRVTLEVVATDLAGNVTRRTQKLTIKG